MVDKYMEICCNISRVPHSEVLSMWMHHHSWRVMIIGGAICTQL